MARRCALLFLVPLLAGCTPVPSAAPSVAPSMGCAFEVRRDVLPTWARAGFSDPSPSGVPYVLGAHGDVLGVMFGYPLTAPPPSGGPANKILWVSRVPVTPPDTLRISARSDGSGVVEREVAGGPGPSVTDMPRPGCWHLTLSWSGHTDTLDLRYEPAGG